MPPVRQPIPVDTVAGGLFANDMVRAIDAALLLRVAPSTLVDWRKRGVGPAHCLVDGKVRYRRSDLDTWAAAHSRHERDGQVKPQFYPRKSV